LENHKNDRETNYKESKKKKNRNIDGPTNYKSNDNFVQEFDRYQLELIVAQPDLHSHRVEIKQKVLICPSQRIILLFLLCISSKFAHASCFDNQGGCK
jgi:hypothetical protein